MDVVQRLEEVLLTIDGACAIFVTDFDGGVVVSAGDTPKFKNVLVSGHLNSISQMQKFLLGEHKSSYFQFDGFQLIVHTIDKYIFFIQAGAAACTGALLNAREKLLPIHDFLMEVCPPLESLND